MRPHRFFVRALVSVLLSAMPGPLNLLPSTRLLKVDLFAIEQQIHKDINFERKSNHVDSLLWNDQVAEEARRHARNIVLRGFFDHEDPLRGNIDERLDRAGVAWRRCAENLYTGETKNAAEDVVRAWRRSPEHRKNMLDAVFKEAGVGAAERQDGTLVIVQAYILR